MLTCLDDFSKSARKVLVTGTKSFRAAKIEVGQSRALVDDQRLLAKGDVERLRAQTDVAAAALALAMGRSGTRSGSAGGRCRCLSRPPGNRGCLVYEPRLLAFIVRTSDSPVCVDLGSARPIRAAIAAWRREIRRYQRDKGGTPS